MRIIIAQHVGFCPGVKRAYAMAEKALESAASPVYLLGDLVHNHQAVQMLEERGAHRVDTIEEIPSRVTVVTRSHGLEKTTHEVLLEKGCTIVDTTCPRVKKVHLLTSQLEKEGFTIIILGDPKHSEIKSLVSELERSPVILSKDPVTWEHEIGSIPFSQRCVVVEQTTFPRTLMERFCSFLHSSPRSDFCTIRDTLCPETEYRQKELVAHIQEGKIDTIIILGGKHS
ncbi:MAG: 4-hydroxy-3-methylbut-2-enyl diphosphate reductase, partial [Candidatus Atribacteria bacterium]|nr:4-hydroxy-3-methylbut-2-enyl diphosphate reductase [Candidatus Atribacteria bacterium]